MKIIDKSKRETFGELNVGDVFKWGTSYHMRINDVIATYGVYNAVSLGSAYAYNFVNETKVQKVDAVMVIGGEEDGEA